MGCIASERAQRVAATCTRRVRDGRRCHCGPTLGRQAPGARMSPPLLQFGLHKPARSSEAARQQAAGRQPPARRLQGSCPRQAAPLVSRCQPSACLPCPPPPQSGVRHMGHTARTPAQPPGRPHLKDEGHDCRRAYGDFGRHAGGRQDVAGGVEVAACAWGIGTTYRLVHQSIGRGRSACMPARVLAAMCTHRHAPSTRAGCVQAAAHLHACMYASLPPSLPCCRTLPCYEPPPMNHSSTTARTTTASWRRCAGAKTQKKKTAVIPSFSAASDSTPAQVESAREAQGMGGGE